MFSSSLLNFLSGLFAGAGLARELGVMLDRVERAVRSAGEIGRVHVCRWGDGSEHLHWWFAARPEALEILRRKPIEKMIFRWNSERFGHVLLRQKFGQEHT